MINLEEFIHDDFKFIVKNEVVDKSLLINYVTTFLEQTKPHAYYRIIKDLDYKNFVIEFLAALAQNKTVIIPHNSKEETFKEIVAKLEATPEPLIYLTTSGSTSEPKLIEKSLKNLLDEIDLLEKNFTTKDCEIKSTVSHVHIYGLLYKVLWPMKYGRLVHSDNIENSYQLARSKDCCLISSPAFLKRIDHEVEYSPNIKLVFSSGGPLNEAIHKKISRHFKRIIEIYGSTETGGIAFRNQSIESNWTLFNNLEIEKLNDQYILHSPFIYEGKYKLDDDLTLLNNQTFILDGRKDTTVKIEEKRINLKHIESKLLELQEVVDCIATNFETDIRQSIEIIIVPNKKSLFNDLSIKEKTNFLRDHLKKHYDDIFIPKTFTFIEEIPYNGQSKITKKEIYEIISRKHSL